MITVVEEVGQSIIEFLIILPLMVGLMILMVKVNTAIQVSIVNQQYVRAQLLFFSYNSAIYPRLKTRVEGLFPYSYNQVLMGMSNKKISDGDEYQGSNKVPDAVEIALTRKKGGSDEKQVEPEFRSNVRIRTTATLCTQTNVIRSPGGSYWPIIDLGPENKGFEPRSLNRLTEGAVFDYCRAPEGIYGDE